MGAEAVADRLGAGDWFEDLLGKRLLHLSQAVHSGVEEQPGDALVAAAARGDRGAWSVLYGQYAPVIHALLVVSIAKRDAEELTHDVFLKAMARLGDLREHGAFGAWVCQIARNEAMSWGRRQQTAKLHLARVADEAIGEVGRTADREGELDTDAVLQQLRQLPEAYRETLALRLIAGLTGPQIAAATGMTHASVRVNLFRGMALLRGALGVGEKGGGP